jgi:bacteriocin-like protein
MANIIISDLQAAELEYEELSDLELEAVIGGKREKTKIDLDDLDGDGRWDFTSIF